MAGHPFPVDPEDPLAPARGQSLDGLLDLLERLDGVEEAAVARSAPEAGMPASRVIDELQREGERRLARGRDPGGDRSRGSEPPGQPTGGGGPPRGGWPAGALLAAEDRILREGCGLVDRSERGKLALTGPEAKAFLHGQVTQDIEALVPGEGAYAAFLTHKGKMLGDLRVLDTGAELQLDTERSALQELFNMIRRYNLRMAVELHRRPLETGLLSLIGPDARRIAGATGLPATEHANARGEIAGHPVRLAVTDAGI